MCCEIAVLKNKWILPLQNSTAFKNTNEINGFVNSGMPVLVISYAMALISDLQNPPAIEP
jgi:hypothetical protein